MELFISILQTGDYLRKEYTAISDRSIEIIESLTVMLFEVITEKILIFALREIDPVPLEFFFKSGFAFDDIFVTALLFEP